MHESTIQVTKTNTRVEQYKTTLPKQVMKMWGARDKDKIEWTLNDRSEIVGRFKRK